MELPNIAARLARLEALVEKAKLDPTPEELFDAPTLGHWRIIENPFGFTVLEGNVAAHPVLRGDLRGLSIYTSPLLRLELGLGWARTFSRFYRLSEPKPGRILLSDEDLARAIERNRQLIPTRPWMFEPPDWSRR